MRSIPSWVRVISSLQFAFTHTHAHTLSLSIQWNYRPLFWVKAFTGYLGNAADLSSAKRLAVLADLKTPMFWLFHAWIFLSSPSSPLLSLLLWCLYLFWRGLVEWASLWGLIRQTQRWNIIALLLRTDAFHVFLLLLQIYCLPSNASFITEFILVLWTKGLKLQPNFDKPTFNPDHPPPFSLPALHALLLPV